MAQWQGWLLLLLLSASLFWVDYWAPTPSSSHNHGDGAAPCFPVATKLIELTPPLSHTHTPILSCADELGSDTMNGLVAVAAAGGKPRLFWVDYWAPYAFFFTQPWEEKDKVLHAGRALFYLK